MPPPGTIPPLNRTTVLAAKGLQNDGYQVRTDPWLLGDEAWDWVAANRDATWDQAGLGDFANGHLIIGKEIDADLLAKLIRVRMGLADKKILTESPQ